jgi:hypothetical protein
MPSYAHFLPTLFLLAAPLLLQAAPVPTSPKALPVEQPIPATVDVVTFRLHSEGEDHKLAVIATPGMLRVDELSDGFSVIYNPATEFYIGLENRNYTYWEFSWPTVRSEVESSKRYETRLRDLGIEGMSGSSSDGDASGSSVPATSSIVSTLLDTNSPSGSPSAPTSTDSDNMGYVWTPTTERKRIADFDCVRWTGQSVAGDPIEAWCYAGSLAPVQNAVAQLRAINEPIALVPVRTLLPTLVLQVNDALAKGGVTPVRISWGGSMEKGSFELVSIKSRKGEASLFTIPKLYRKTTLVTMDGIGNQKVQQTITPEPDEKRERPDNLPGAAGL